MNAGTFTNPLFKLAALAITCSIMACSGGGKADVPVTTTGGGGTPAPITVSLTPGSADLAVANALPIAASITGTSDTELHWYVDTIENGNASVGSILGSGTSVSYLAPDTAGTHILAAASRVDPTRKGTATIRVRGLQIAVALSPANSTLAIGGSQSFTVGVSGSTNTAVVWSVDGLTGGSASVGLITGSGSTVIYAAPGNAGSHTVSATSAADPSKQASSTVIVQAAPAPISISLSPAAFSLGGGGAQALAASVSGTTNTAVIWTVDGINGGNASTGLIAGTGLNVTYSAPVSAGTHTIIATSVADSSRHGSAAATVMSGCAPAASSTQVFNVRDAGYGALGNGLADDTAAIQRAVNAASGTGGTVYVPPGTYLINALTSVSLKSNLTFSMATDAVLKAIPNSASNYAMLKLSNVNSVNVLGGTILGERSTHTGTGGEWGHGMVLNNAQHVVIQGLSVKECWGDGIDVAFSSDVTICNIVADHNRRQGMSITSVNGMIVRGSTFKNTAGTLPEDGIDIEPNQGETVNNVLITGCTFTGNAGNGVQVGVPIKHTGLAWATGVVVDGNTCSGNGTNTLSSSPRSGIQVSNSAGHQVTNNTITGNLGNGILMREGANSILLGGNTITMNAGDGIQEYLCNNATISGNVVTNNSGHGIYSPSCTGVILTANTVSGNGMVP